MSQIPRLKGDSLRQIRVSQTNPAVAKEMRTIRVIFILCLSLGMRLVQIEVQ